MDLLILLVFSFFLSFLSFFLVYGVLFVSLYSSVLLRLYTTVIKNFLLNLSIAYHSLILRFLPTKQ